MSATLDALRAARRLGVVRGPSPVLEARDFADQYKVRLLVKREDSLGPSIGSTKARRLDAALAAALDQGVSDVVTIGANGSNQTRMIAWLGRQFGFTTHAVVLPCDMPRASVNARETGLYGVTSHPLDESERLFAEARAKALASKLEAEGRRVCVIGFGAPEPPGIPGMIDLAEELVAAPAWDRLLLPVGSGATLHGLETAAALGIDAFADKRSVIAVGLEQTTTSARIDRLLTRYRRTSGKALGIDIQALPHVDVHLAPLMTYAERTASVAGWARRIATVMDPYYHARTLDRLVTLINDGEVAQGETVMFLLTGGAQDACSDFADWA